uniref:Uncharacterized protein n=1 Tax=Anguilla anguilla TaxID=7936 RepID=A0A0E9XFA2_ANGAN
MFSTPNDFASKKSQKALELQARLLDTRTVIVNVKHGSVFN